MKTSLDWLRDFVTLPWEARELSQRLTSAGLEVEGIEEIGKIPDGVVVAQILERKKHENSDHLSVCQVSTGSGDPLQIVCGAPNCDAGKKVPLATIGTDLGGGFVIKKSKLRGVESFGMLCASDELGLPGGEHSGLMILPEDAPLGVPLNQLLPSDTVIDWEVTPNRPDWLSHLGIAREIAAVSSSTFTMPETKIRIAGGKSVNEAAKVRIEAPDLCPRYIARVFENVKIGPSPEWMVRRLQSVGLRSVNNVVDITNYVMMEYGQPLHAFDLKTLAGSEIIVRRAKAGEKMVTLDGTNLELTTDNLVISDRDRGVALAGIMGAENSMITDDTTTVLLESAAFDRSNIRISSRKLGKATDSSYRFERGISPELTALASERAASLLCQYAGAEQLEGVIDCYPAPWKPKQIRCRIAKINGLLGLQLSAEEIAACLKRRGIEIVSSTPDELVAQPPFWRFDLYQEVDFAEEVAQIQGLDSIPEASSSSRLGGIAAEDCFFGMEGARNQLLSLGLDEIVNYSMGPLNECLAGTTFQEADILRVSNPISNDTAYLRPTLRPGILKVVNHNVSRNTHDLGIFEIGRVFQLKNGKSTEHTEIAIAMSGRRQPERFGAEKGELVDFFSLKGLLESWLEARGLRKFRCEVASHPAFQEGACASIQADGQQIFVFGQVHPALVKGIRLRSPLFIAIGSLETLENIAYPVKKHQGLPQFPGTSRDISFVAPAGLTHQTIVDTVMKMKLPLLEKVELFDIFADEKVLGAGRQSMSYSLTFCNPERTLTDDEVNKLQDKVRKVLAAELDVELR